MPDHAVAPGRKLTVTTKSWSDGQGKSRGAGEYEVLAIGWSNDQEPPGLSFLVFAPLSHEVFWVSPELVDKVHGYLPRA